VAARFDYTPAGLQSLVRDFRAGKLELFPQRRPGPKRAPAKDAARARVVELRLAGHSIDEISEALTHEGTPLNRTGVSEIMAEEWLPRIWRRPEHERGPVRREQLPRAKVLDFAQLSAVSPTRVAGLLLAVPDLLALDLPGLIRKAGYPGTREIPALSSILALLALKLTATRWVSHVEDLAADPGAALFAGLATLPKKSSLTAYSYRLDQPASARSWPPWTASCSGQPLVGRPHPPLPARLKRGQFAEWNGIGVGNRAGSSDEQSHGLPATDPSWRRVGVGDLRPRLRPA
jgi:hypothetical protein